MFWPCRLCQIPHRTRCTCSSGPHQWSPVQPPPGKYKKSTESTMWGTWLGPKLTVSGNPQKAPPLFPWNIAVPLFSRNWRQKIPPNWQHQRQFEFLKKIKKKKFEEGSKKWLHLYFLQYKKTVPPMSTRPSRSRPSQVSLVNFNCSSVLILSLVLPSKSYPPVRNCTEVNHWIRRKGPKLGRRVDLGFCRGGEGPLWFRGFCSWKAPQFPLEMGCEKRKMRGEIGENEGEWGGMRGKVPTKPIRELEGSLALRASKRPEITLWPPGDCLPQKATPTLLNVLGYNWGKLSESEGNRRY